MEIKELNQTYLRGHTCHAVGNQLLLLGGGSPGKGVDPLMSCNPRLLNIIDMNNPQGVGSPPQSLKTAV